MKTHSSLVLGMSPIVWLEMTEGTRNKLDLKLVTVFLGRFSLVYPTRADIDWAMRQLSAFHLSHQIEAFDCLIAAPSYRLQLSLYTRNLKHFAVLLGNLAQQPY
jgi:predicted nucleic acid-binding protein